MIEDEKTGLFFIDPTQVEMIPIDRLKLYKRNAKKHTPEQIEQIVNSIKAFGMNDPIAVWGDENVIVEGHGRFMALRSLGEQGEVPCIRLDHLTDEQRKAYALAHNQLTMNTGWDDELLLPELDELGDFFDMGDFGFDLEGEDEHQSTASLDNVLEDDAPELEDVVSVCKPGQLWKLGAHRLMCGDSTSASDFEKLMQGDKADMVFTDPPYGVAIGDKNATLNSVQKAGLCCTNIAGDTMSEDNLYEMLKDAFTNVRENCKDDASYYVTSPQGGSLGLMMMMMKDAGLEVRHVLMWRKNSATFSLGRLDYDYQHEPIFYTWTKSHHNYRHGKYRTTVWDFDKPRKCDLHPTMKPVALVANAIMDGTKEGDLVLDAFGGSGTTIIASEQLNRQARMMELDPHYCDVIIKRWENLTGQTAELLEE